MSEFAPKSERLGRLIAAAPEMYELLKHTAFYIKEADKLKPLPSELMDYAKRISELLTRIDGDVMSEGLKPCPFCGGKSELISDDFIAGDETYVGEIYSVQCCNCIACTKWDASSDNAIAAWNRRA